MFNGKPPTDASVRSGVTVLSTVMYVTTDGFILVSECLLGVVLVRPPRSRCPLESGELMYYNTKIEML